MRYKIPESIQIFEKFCQEYDNWFSRNKWIYRSEIEAVKKLIPKHGLGLDVGVGTGRFSFPFGIKIGIDPSKMMGLIAKKRGINIICGVGELLPFRKEIFDFVLIVTTICFVKEPLITLKEIKRILKIGGSIIIGFIDKNSELGKLYESKKDESKFYRTAKFYSAEKMQKWLDMLSFSDLTIYQTLFHNLNEINTVESIKEGYGKGGFLVFKGKKQKK
ncbi:class I SAM-dependent methyltransferase [[Eubacterium] cellulosolvens]